MKGIFGRFGLAISLLAIAALFGWTLWLTAHHWRPSVDNFHYQGIDVSAADGDVDWDAARVAGASFGYIRATDGTDRDPHFEGNWHGAAAAGLRRGAMHRWSLCRLATDQANGFITTVPRGEDALPPAVEMDFVDGCDARPARDAVIGEVGRFIRMVEAHSGGPVVLQVSHSFEAAYHVTGAFDRPVWSTGNFFPPDYAARPWRMWRANDMRRVEGFDGPVKWDVVAK